MIAAALPVFAFLFFSPWAALGVAAGAVSIPIVIHLLSRRRFRIVTWAAMRFLLQAQKQNIRKMRLEQLLLLACRCLMLLLLVLAMASVMPWAEALWYRLFPDSAVLAAAGLQRTHKVLVLDGSMSMALKTGDGSCFDRARARANQIMEAGSGADGFSVVFMTAPAVRVVPEPSENRRKVQEEIAKLRLPHGNADLAGALHAVDDMLRTSPTRYEAREVYFLTDLQGATWTGPANRDIAETMQRIQGRARVAFVDVGQEATDNLAVTGLTLREPLATTETPVTVLATLQRFGGTEARETRAELLIGKARAAAGDPPFQLRTVEQRLMTMQPGSSATVAFQHVFTTPGEYAVQVRLESDALEPDDARALVITVKDTVPVMLVNGKPAADPEEEATYYLRYALNPVRTGPAPRNFPARPRVLSEAQFADATLGDLTPFDCVFLCDVPRLGSAEVRRLETHLQRGGGVVFCLGPHVDLEAYNRLVYRNGAGILPAKLLGVQRAATDRACTFYANDERAFRQPPLAAFADDEQRANLLAARFQQYVRVELPPKERTRKLLAFMPETQKADGPPPKDGKAGPNLPLPAGDSALVEWARHRGRVVLFTSTVNTDWTTWPGGPTFPPLFNEVMRFAVAGRLRGQTGLVGEPLVEYLSAGSAGLEVKVQTPDGRTEQTTTQTEDDSAVMRWTETDQSGIYRMTLGQHPREHLFAVNVPVAAEGQQASESNLARVDKAGLQSAYPQWEFQVVREPGDVVHALPSTNGDGPVVLRGMGTAIARFLLLAVLVLALVEVLLAWRLGHHSKTAANATTASGRALPITVGIIAGLLFIAVAGVLIHTAWTQDFLGFLPDRVRGSVEAAFGVPQAVPGESSHWRLEYTPYLIRNAAQEPWVIGLLASAALGLVGYVYTREGRTASGRQRALFAGLRIFLILLMLVVLLPQLQLWFERQGWPDVVVLIDDSASMSATDQCRDPRVQEAAQRLAGLGGLTEPQRLQLAQTLLTHPDSDWLGQLLSDRKVKLHIYRCSASAARVADVSQPDQRDAAVAAIRALRANGEPSRLGQGIQQALKEFRGSSIAALIMLTDGITTEGEDLVQASRYAVEAGVPLYFVGMGDSHEVRDLILHDLQVEDTVFVHDRLVFEARLTAQGYVNMGPVPVILYEKTKDGQLKEVARERVTPDPQGKPTKFRITHRPSEPGEKVYVLEATPQPDEVQPPDNNRLERTVFVREAKPSRVLYIEGYARSEFRFVKTLLEREGAGDKGQKSIELKVLLLDAQEDWHLQDRSARPDFPTKEELNQFDVVILGDVDLKHPKMGEKNVRLLVDFVRERGGGLLLIAGKRDNPRSYKDSPLADVLPIQITGVGPLDDPDAPRAEGFRPVLTPLGRMHPIFRFSPDEAENAAIWNHLAEIYWYADGYKLQPAAEVLAVHPKTRAGARVPASATGDERLPLMVQHFVGAGRCMFLGIEETWAWGFREDQLRFNQFWIQTVNYLARHRLGRIDLRLDRQTPYRRGEPIKLMVRFPDDAPPPNAGTEIKVSVEHRPPKGKEPAETEVQTLQLAKVQGSRASYEALLTRTPEGEYRFRLSAPSVTGPQPRVECRVLPPPGEMERLQMNQPDMERAAEQTHGKFYTLADADKLLEELPTGTRIVTSTPGPPWLLWNHPATFALMIGLFGAEWILRKRKHLL